MSLNICRGNLSLEHLLVRRFKKIFFKTKMVTEKESERSF
jgi:hypothetical protein